MSSETSDIACEKMQQASNNLNDSCDQRRILSKLQTKSPFQVLREKSNEFKLNISSPEFARKLDQEDHLASFRDQFCIPTTSQLPYG